MGVNICASLLCMRTERDVSPFWASKLWKGDEQFLDDCMGLANMHSPKTFVSLVSIVGNIFGLAVSRQSADSLFFVVCFRASTRRLYNCSYIPVDKLNS